MAIKETLEIINAMEAAGVIGRYAIAGAVAAYNYVEPAVTDDLDILISFREPHQQTDAGLVTLAPIFSYLKQRGLMSTERRELSLRAGRFSSYRSLTTLTCHLLRPRRWKSRSMRTLDRCCRRVYCARST